MIFSILRWFEIVNDGVHPCVDRNIFENMFKEEITKGVWNTLKKAYDGRDKFKKVKPHTLKCQILIAQNE